MQLSKRDGFYMNDHDACVQEEALKWLRFARDDLDASVKMTGMSRHVCWLSQQAVEKAIKAALILEKIEFPYVHGLRLLKETLPKVWDIPATKEEMHTLAGWAVEA